MHNEHAQICMYMHTASFWSKKNKRENHTRVALAYFSILSPAQCWLSWLMTWQPFHYPTDNYILTGMGKEPTSHINPRSEEGLRCMSLSEWLGRALFKKPSGHRQHPKDPNMQQADPGDTKPSETGQCPATGDEHLPHRKWTPSKNLQSINEQRQQTATNAKNK